MGERDVAEDVTSHPELGIAASQAAIDFAVAHDERFRDLAVDVDEHGGEPSRTTGSPDGGGPGRSILADRGRDA